jgi:hypothetical protein
MSNAQTDVIIANPIYDVVFKNLMTTVNDVNRENARYFIGTVLGEEIVEIDFLPQEYTHNTKPKIKKDLEKVAAEEKEEAVAEEAEASVEEKKEELSIIRLDFVATIRTKSGEYKKALIELQKSQKSINIMRFRNYLGEQYKQFDTVTVNGKIEKHPIPIIVIYILGYNLSGYNAIVMKRDSTYTDLLSTGDNRVVIKEPGTGNNPEIEYLTHESYYIQTLRINSSAYTDWEKCSELKQMLSLFEQNHFVIEEKHIKKYIKKYPYTINNKKLKRMIETLKYIATNPVTRKEMEDEYWSALEDEMWENTLSENRTLLSEKKTMSSENEALRRLLRQAGIEIPNI